MDIVISERCASDKVAARRGACKIILSKRKPHTIYVLEMECKGHHNIG